MPVSFQFVAVASANITSWPLASSLPVTTGSFVTCDAVAHTQQYFLGVLDRAYPSDYVAGLQSSFNSGYELFQAAASVGERVSLAISRFECCSFVISAHGGVLATGTIEVVKTDPTPFTMKQGSRFTTSHGQAFVTTQDVVFTAMSLGPFSVPIAAVAVGYEYNVPGQVIAANGELLPGDISQISYIITVPDVFDPTVTISQISPTNNGASACLDGLAQDLGITRKAFENDDQFRLRIKETPDTVSPNAIIRGVNRLLRAQDPTYSCVLREIGYTLFPGIYYDAGSANGPPTPQNPDRNFAWDMNPNQRPEDRYKTFVNTIDMRGFFLVEVPVVTTLSSFGFSYDGSDFDARRRENAYDTTALDLPDVAYDGFTTYEGSFYKSIYNLIDQKRAGGVGFDIVQTFVPAPVPPPT